MGICLYISITIISAGIFVWIIPIFENFSSVYPSIILIEGMKHTTDPPLYSALLKTLQQFENIQNDPKSAESPIYDESTSVIPDISDPNHLNLYLIKDEINPQNSAAPVNSKIKAVQRPIIEFFNKTGEWKELWETSINGVIYLIFKSKGGSDIGLVYKVLEAESQLHIIRYYPNSRVPSYLDYTLPGSNKVSSISIKDDLLVYSRVDGFYSFHVLKIFKTEDGLVFKELETGEILNRTSWELNEVTGVKIVPVDSVNYLMVTKVMQAFSSKARVVLNIYSVQNSSFMQGTLYNISISEYVHHAYHNFNYLSPPKLKISDGNSVFAGHYDNILMFIRYIDSSFEGYYLSAGLSAEFTHIDISKSGQYAVITIPGFNERERLRLIKVMVFENSVRETGFDVALDHLPNSLMQKSIRAIKVIDWQDKVYVMMFYSNGATVLVDFNYELITELDIDDLDSSVFGKVSMMAGMGLLAFWVICGRRIMVRRIHIR